MLHVKSLLYSGMETYIVSNELSYIIHRFTRLSEMTMDLAVEEDLDYFANLIGEKKNWEATSISQRLLSEEGDIHARRYGGD
jgi:hypothetical protein